MALPENQQLEIPDYVGEAPSQLMRFVARAIVQRDRLALSRAWTSAKR